MIKPIHTHNFVFHSLLSCSFHLECVHQWFTLICVLPSTQNFFIQNIANALKKIFFRLIYILSQGLSLSKSLFCTKFFSQYPLSPCILLLPLYLSNIINLFSVKSINSRKAFLSPVIRFDFHIACSQIIQCLSFVICNFCSPPAFQDTLQRP